MRGGILNALHMEALAKEEEAQKEAEAEEERKQGLEGSTTKGKTKYQLKGRVGANDAKTGAGAKVGAGSSSGGSSGARPKPVKKEEAYDIVQAIRKVAPAWKPGNPVPMVRSARMARVILR
jgi:hypothetical protein